MLRVGRAWNGLALRSSRPDGFTADLQDEATRRSDVVLVDLERLYAGD